MQGKNICVTHQKRFQVAKLNKVDHTTEHKCKPLDLLANLCPYSHLWLRAQVLTKRMRSQMQTVEICFM